ncbi:MAG: hypothetical protein Q3985_01280 [Eubacteriales bacterium]|nr:hypothetical protein [Eubacteriales bacterium]
MIKIGNGYFRKDQIAGIVPDFRATGISTIRVYLIGGESVVLAEDRSCVERIAEALGGAVQDDNCSYVLKPSEIMELGDVQEMGMTHIARDADGLVYAYSEKPHRDGAYWVSDRAFLRLSGDYDDLIPSKDGPIEIKNILEVN